MKRHAGSHMSWWAFSNVEIQILSFVDLSVSADNSSNDLHSSSMHQEMIRTMECTVHNVTMRAILVACENFNNNFVNYTVVAELFRDRQVVSSAQLSFSR